MSIYYISTLVAAAIAAAIIYYKLKKTKQLKKLLEIDNFTKLSSVNPLIIIHISLIVIGVLTLVAGFKEKNLSMFISSLMIVDLCFFELMNFTFDGTIYYSNNTSIISNTKVKNKQIVRVQITGKIFKSATVILTNGNTYIVGYKAGEKLKELLKK